MSEPEVILDFHTDFREIVAKILVANGVSVDPIESYGDVVYRFYANRRRRVAPFCYCVVEADELACPPDLAAGYAELKAELVEGADVTARLSHNILNATYEDALFNDWGITHFHLGLRDERGDVPRTKILLFALVRGEAVYAIGFFKHGSWTEIELLEIAHRNWRNVIEHARVKGTSLPGNFTPNEHAKMRKAGGTVLVQVGGDVYAPIGGGYSAAKTSMTAHREADRAMICIDWYEKIVRDNLTEIVADFTRAGQVVGIPPHFRFGFDNEGRAMFGVPESGAYALLAPFPP